jgi:SAM-dependent methyltransferase
VRFQRAQQARRPAGVRCYGSAVRDPLHFDRTAAAYDAVRPGYPGPLIDAVLAEAGTVTEALELGCGSGQLTRSLATRGLKVHAIDIGAALLKRARANFAAYPQVRFEQADLRAWSPPRRCDLVASASAFHWLPTKQALALAADALPPGGTRARYSGTTTHCPSQASTAARRPSAGRSSPLTPVSRRCRATKTASPR